MNHDLQAHGMKGKYQISGWSRAQVKKVPYSRPLTTAVPSRRALRRCSGPAEPNDSPNSQKKTLENTSIQWCPSSPSGSLDMKSSERQEVKDLSIRQGLLTTSQGIMKEYKVIYVFTHGVGMIIGKKMKLCARTELCQRHRTHGLVRR